MRCCLLNVAIFSFALFLRVLVGFHPHSGQDDYQGERPADTSHHGGKPKKYGGDYEAQRHWMEVTYHLPISEWYYHDLEYWGLDYPPLTAYVSWLCGWVAHNVGSLHDKAFGNEEIMDGVCKWDDEASASACIDQMQKNSTGRKCRKGLGVLKDLVALYSSRWGFEESGGKLYMRFTVLLLDLLVYMSAVWVLVARLTKDGEEQSTSTNRKDDTIIPTSQRSRTRLLLAALTQPALILIDHGHFQYNTVSLGLALWSFHYMTLDGWSGPILGSILFSLALNFKQMELYHAPAIFAYLLGRCFRYDKSNGQSARTFAAGKFCSLGVTVLAVFAILWAPFAISPSGTASPPSSLHLDGIVQLFQRIFPFNRGIFEGKVANIWCALSVKPFSIRHRLPPSLLPWAALGLTFLLILPPCWILFWVGKGDSIDKVACANGSKASTQITKLKGCSGDIRLLLWGTAATSLAFFLASFQVHEKGILIPLAPISLLAIDAPHFVSFFSIVATWSLWPLLVIDRLSDAYFCCLVVFLCIDSLTKAPSSELSSYDEEIDIFRYITRYIPPLSWIVMILLHISEWVIDPPHNLPDLYPVLWSFAGCGLFCISYLAMVWAMAVQRRSEKKDANVSKRGRKRVKSKSSIPPVSVSALGALLLSYSATAFVHPQGYCHSRRVAYTDKKHLFSRGSKKNHDTDDSIITDDLLDRARLPLKWEVQRRDEARPVLDLSARNSDSLSLAEGADQSINRADDTTNTDETSQVDDGWKDGQVWDITKQHLLDTGIAVDQKKLLTDAPQLLRLPTLQIVKAASFLLSYPCGTNSTSLLELDPSLMTYLADDLKYGLEEYLPNMMFMGNSTLAAGMIQTQLTLAPSMAVNLVRMGVDGGLDERQISRALGNAGKASGKAVEGVVGEMGRSYKEYKRLKGGKGSLQN